MTVSNTYTRALLPMLLLCAFSARAADNEGAARSADEPESYHWGLGIGADVRKSPYEGIGSKTTVLPLESFDNRYVRLFGNQFDIKLPSYGAFDFSLRTQITLNDGYKASDSPELNGMADRKSAIFVGGASTWHTDIAKVSVTWMKDISGHSKGSEFKLNAEHPFQFAERFEIAPHAEFARLDSKYVNYYYGVHADEATVSRPEYLGKATSDVQAGVRFGYLFAPKQRLLLDITDTRLGSGITDSSIVAHRSMPDVKIGYIYAF